ncbi:MAG: rod shape-determining protein RodA [Oscillospiraceae bacterium]|nr:rod shape-determining protein RodA [Oscillospiraceae bacterium]
MNVWASDIKKRLGTVDWILVAAVLLSSVYGYVLIISATSVLGAAQFRSLLVHVVAAVVGFAFMFVLSQSDYDHMIKYSRYLYAFGVIILVFTLVFGKGDEVGNRSWLRISVGGTSVGGQPSEIVKITFIMTFARHLDRVKEEINKPKNILLLGLHFVVIFGLILMQGDLGTGLVYIFVFVAMCFAGGVSLWYFFAALFIAAASSPLVWNMMSDNQKKRILVGFDPELDPMDKGFQALTSRRAIGSGGLFGTGYKSGYYTQNGIIPKQWTDFIYSAAGEEFGFIGAILVLVLLSVVIVRIFMISRRAQNNAGSLICIGVMAVFVAQVAENIGMCLGLLPVIGIPLPFFSYGGSSILGSLLGVGLVLSVNSRRNIYYFTRGENSDEF